MDSSLGKMLDAKKNKGTLHPYLGNSNVRWGDFELSGLSLMKFEDHEEERYSLREGDLVVCEGGEPGRCAIWRGQIPGMKIQKALHRVRATNGLINEYLYYWLTLAARTGLLEPHFTGTTIKHLTGRALASLELPLPPLDVQKEIVGALKPIDQRIDLIRQTIITLEAIAQALFKSWFVDFDPVHAKTEGREPEGMDAATAALFPSEFEESELGLVPKGWRADEIGKVVPCVGGGTPST
jgi:type I restriction enzyme S subunit